MTKNQIPLTFNKVKCPRTEKSWYEIKHYVQTQEERSNEWQMSIEVSKMETFKKAYNRIILKRLASH